MLGEATEFLRGELLGQDALRSRGAMSAWWLLRECESRNVLPLFRPKLGRGARGGVLPHSRGARSRRDGGVASGVTQYPFDQSLRPSRDAERIQRLHLLGGGPTVDKPSLGEWPHHNHPYSALCGERQYLQFHLPLPHAECPSKRSCSPMPARLTRTGCRFCHPVHALGTTSVTLVARAVAAFLRNG